MILEKNGERNSQFMWIRSLGIKFVKSTVKEYKKDQAKFIEENMNIKFLQYQKDFINTIMDEKIEEQKCINKLLQQEKI